MNKKIKLTPKRVIVRYKNTEERLLHLSNIPDNVLFSDTLSESISLWLQYQTPEYVRLFNRINDIVNLYTPQTFNIPTTYNITNNTAIDNNLPDNIALEYLDSTKLSSIPAEIELYMANFFCGLPDINKNVIKEPNGLNECPDLQVNFSDGMNAFVEFKSVLCSMYSDGKFRAPVNNAMKGTDLILSDMRNNKCKVNKCGTNIRNITVLFAFYFVDPIMKQWDIFKLIAVPAPLVVDCEFNQDGTFKKLGQKSNNNFNTVLNLKIRQPFEKYNSLVDRALLISTGKTSLGLSKMISNKEGEYMELKLKFNDILEYSNILLSEKLCSAKEVTEILDNLKTYKYNTNMYATADDKLFIKHVINFHKQEIKLLKRLKL